jgi:superfamily I DNA/RNA helicase
MAIMWPSRVPDWVRNDPRRSTEVEVFGRLSSQLDSSWTVFYSRPWWGINAKGGEIDGEADFIIAHPGRGILFLEVKGGAISYDPGREQWFSRDRYGVTHAIKDPIGQAKKCKHQYLAKLRRMPGWPEEYIRFRHGVLFPDSSAPGPAVPAVGGNEKELFCFADEYECSLPGWIEKRLAAHEHTATQTEVAPGETGVGLLRKLVADPVTLRMVSGRAIQAEYNQIEALLTGQQLTIISLLEEVPRAVIEGGAGTGKTLLAMEIVARLTDKGKSVCLLCFNEPLAKWMQEKLAHSQKLTVGTFHGICFGLVKDAHLNYDSAAPGFMKNILPQLAIEALQILPRRRYDAIIVDEGQDILDEWWDVIGNLAVDGSSGYLRVFFDSNQAIYRVPGDTALLLDAQKFPLRHNLRNTKSIARVTNSLYKGPLIQALGPDGERPLFESLKYEDAKERARNKVRALVVENGNIKGDIAVLFGSETEASGFRQELSQLGLATSTAGERNRDAVTVDTIRRFKGLEAKVAILVVDRVTSNQQELAYIAVSRAQIRLFVYGDIRGTVIEKAALQAQTGASTA